MAEKQQDQGHGPETGGRIPFGEAVVQTVGSIAALAMQQAMEAGRIINIPSLGLALTKDGIKNISELTAEELQRNPHITAPPQK